MNWCEYLDAVEECFSVQNQTTFKLRQMKSKEEKWKYRQGIRVQTLRISAIATVLLIACPIAFKTISFPRLSYNRKSRLDFLRSWYDNKGTLLLLHLYVIYLIYIKLQLLQLIKRKLFNHILQVSGNNKHSIHNKCHHLRRHVLLILKNK